MVDEYIKDVCDILDIQPPLVSFDTSKFATDTMQAMCDPSGKVIYIRRKKNPDADYMLAIAHELRHIWQITQNPDLLKGYRPINMMESLEAYNLQPAEVDANAFAAMVMADFFHLSPQWQGMSQKVVDAINKRINILAH